MKVQARRSVDHQIPTPNFIRDSTRNSRHCRRSRASIRIKHNGTEVFLSVVQNYRLFPLRKRPRRNTGIAAHYAYNYLKVTGWLSL